VKVELVDAHFVLQIMGFMGFEDFGWTVAAARIPTGCACTRLHPHLPAQACGCQGDRWRAVEAYELDMLTHRLFFAILDEEEAVKNHDDEAVKESEQRQSGAEEICLTSEGSRTSSSSSEVNGEYVAPPGYSKTAVLTERFPYMPAGTAHALDQTTLSNKNHPHDCIPCKFQCYSFNVKCKYGSECQYCHMQHSSNRMNRKIKSRLAQAKKSKWLNSV